MPRRRFIPWAGRQAALLSRANRNWVHVRRQLAAAAADEKFRAAVRESLDFAEYLTWRTVEAHAGLAELDGFLARLRQAAPAE